MKGFITPHGIANTVRMAHGQRRVTFLLVEGATDLVFFGRYVEPTRCEVMACHGRENVLEATRILDEGREAGFLAFADADWHHLSGETPTSPNLIYSDSHDLLVDILCSPALERLLAERGSRDKIEQFQNERGTPVLDVLLSEAAAIGRVRWHSHRESLNFSFAGLEIHAYADDGLLVDLTRVIAVVVQRSHSTIPVQAVHAGCRALEGGFDVRQVAAGHDAVALLSLGLRGALGSQKAIDVKVETLELELRLGFDDACLRSTAFYEAFIAWEARNPDWKVLRSLAA